ncbi:MAG: hypothetical protein Ct9H90mP18_00150 [Gammaproteobacteria bacterium]|nr:MAG: hypothetical protein Ct9H90mP18_00150 [Gammaproteobacteria bacterium]
MAKRKTIYEDSDILVVGGGMAGTGATFESRYWGRDMKKFFVQRKQISIEVGSRTRIIRDKLLYGHEME